MGNGPQQQLVMTLRWKNHPRLDVNYMSWEVFRDTVDAFDRENLPNNLMQYDLIWGGADFALDLRYVYVIRRLSPLLTFETRNKVYGLRSKKKVERHIEMLQALTNRIPLWPPMDEMLASARKADTIKIFDQIARDVTHTARPVTYPLTLPITEFPANMVLKREGSDTAAHVVLPSDVAALTLAQFNRMAKGPFRWLAQTWLPLLRQFGEWRVYIVGGRILEIITTAPEPNIPTYINQLKVDIVKGMWSLAELT